MVCALRCDSVVGTESANLCNALPVLSSEENCPCDPPGVLALEEKRFGFAILESEYFAVTTDVELPLSFHHVSIRFFAFQRPSAQ